MSSTSTTTAAFHMPYTISCLERLNQQWRTALRIDDDGSGGVDGIKSALYFAFLPWIFFSVFKFPALSWFFFLANCFWLLLATLCCFLIVDGLVGWMVGWFGRPVGRLLVNVLLVVYLGLRIQLKFDFTIIVFVLTDTVAIFSLLLLFLKIPRGSMTWV